MKQGLHPDYMPTVVHCNGCGITFESHSTIPQITVEICSNCHPFYTGKQKLLDTAGRVDKFNARRAQATKLQAARAQTRNQQADPELAKIETELEAETVDKAQPTAKPKKAAPKRSATKQ